MIKQIGDNSFIVICDHCGFNVPNAPIWDSLDNAERWIDGRYPGIDQFFTIIDSVNFVCCPRCVESILTTALASDEKRQAGLATACPAA